MSAGDRCASPPRAREGAGRFALVTGASSGIGQALAQVMAARGYDLALLARRTDRLEELAEELRARHHITALPVTADLSDPDTPRRVMTDLRAHGRPVTFLVNNAGYSQIGRYGELDWTAHQQRLRVLAWAPLELTHLVLPGMLDAGWGRVLNVGSIAGCFHAYPQDALYNSTKRMIEAFTESLAAEYRDRGIFCTVSIPGFTDTEIYDSSGFGDFVRSKRLYRAAMMSPDTVARQAYEAVMNGRPRIVHGPHHQLMAATLNHLPLPLRRRLSIAISGAIQTDVPAPDQKVRGDA